MKERDERLEVMKGALGRLAHDCNNLLAPMLGYITLIKEDARMDDPAAAYINAVEGAARQAESRLQTVLLAMRPHRRFSPRSLDFGELVRKEVASWKSGAGAGVGIEVIAQVEPGSWVMADEQQWQCVLRELLKNARFALALGGTVEIGLAPEEMTEEEARRLGMLAGEAWRLVVRDDGIGMNEATARRAFDPFFSTRTQTKAPGLGLTLVHSVARAHGGQTVLETTEDRGTEVTVWLPGNRPAAVERTVETGGISTGERRRKALLVEKDPFIRELLWGWLQAEGFEIYVTSNEEEAAWAVKEEGAGMALIVADLDSAQSRKAMVEMALGEAPCVLITNRAATELAGEFNALPPIVLEKPFRQAAFRAAIARVLGKGQP